MKRPLWVIGLAYAAGLLVAALAGLNTSLWLGVVCLLLLAGALLFPALRRRAAVTAVLLTGAAAFFVFAGMEALTVRPLAALSGTVQTVTGQVVKISDRVCSVKAEAGGVPKGTVIALSVGRDKAMPALYDRISGEMLLQALPARSGLKADGAQLKGSLTVYGPEGLTMETPAKKPLLAGVAEMRDRFSGSIRRRLPGDEGALVTAMCTGDKTALSPDVKFVFRQAGLSHLLAVSGLHMAILAQAVLGLLRFLRVPRRWAALGAAGVVVPFMLLTGMTPSVVRSGVMCLVLLAGQLLRRRADSRNSLGLALLLLVLPNPYVVLDVGLQLSFAATVGLVVFGPWMQDKAFAWLRRGRPEEWEIPGWARRPTAAMCVSLAAMLPTLPIVAVTFGELSLIAPLSNLAAVFPATLLVVSGCLAMVLDAVPFLGWAARGLLLAAGLVAKYLLGLTGGVAGWRFATVSMTQPYLLVWLIGALLLMLLGYRLLGSRGLRRSAALSVIVLACGIGAHTVLMRGVTTVTTVPAGDSLALILERDGHAGLVAAGPDAYTLTQVAYALRARGIRRLDFLLLPQPEGDFAQGLDAFARDIAVDCLLLPETGETAIPAGRRLTYGERDAVRCWNDGMMEFEKGGWVRLCFGDTRVLLCPPGGSAAALPADWRRTHLAVFTGLPPRQATALTAQGGVMSCSDGMVPYVTKALPWGAYPLRLLVGQEPVSVTTRGLGDLHLPRDGGFIS